MNCLLPISDLYRDAIRVAVVLQIPLTFFLLLLLDGGQLAKIGGCAMCGFWGGVAMMVLRRPRTPNRLDLALIKVGYPLAFFAAVLCATAFNR